MSNFKWLKRLVAGPLAVLWMNLLAQLIWYRQETDPMHRVTGSAVNMFAQLVTFFEYPTPEIANIGASGLSSIVLALAFVQTDLKNGILRRLETFGCNMHENIYHGPGLNTTYDVRADGRLCNNHGRQLLAIMQRLDDRMYAISKDHCYIFCWDVIPSDGSRLHGFVISATGNQEPSRKLCPTMKGSLGQCLRDGKESPPRASPVRPLEGMY